MKKSSRLTISLDAETRKKLGKMARHEGASVAFIIRKIIALFLKNWRQEK